jgi:hypothetical protein
MLFRELAHERDRGAIRYPLGEVVPPRFLLGAEVGTVEELLQAQDLHLLASGLFDERNVPLDHCLFDRRELALGAEHIPRLDEPTAHCPGH